MHIGLLECDNVVGRFPHIAGGYREMFTSLLAPYLQDLRFSYLDVVRGELPPEDDACDAYMATGSQYSVYEPHDWIPPFSRFLQELRLKRKPFVGICFGHQMLAHALGGKVARSPQGWGVGVLEAEVLRPEPWMEPPQARFRIPHMHADEVQRLPEGSTLLARSRHCEVEMFRVGESMLGIEGHPEFSAPFAEALIRARADRIGADKVGIALESLRGATDAPAVGRWIAQFLSRGA
jgi:GMP synthase-like glutamine amidotransferase